LDEDVGVSVDDASWVLSREQAMQQLNQFTEQHARVLFRATAKVCTVLAFLSAPALWASLGGLWAGLGVGFFCVCIALGYPLSRIDARKRERAWRSLDWANGVGFVSPNRGLVYLGASSWALASMGRVFHPGAVRGVCFDPESHSLMFSVIHHPHAWIEDVGLPPGVPVARGEALADTLTKAWGLPDRGPA
jgi:hypothetical protein